MYIYTLLVRRRGDDEGISIGAGDMHEGGGAAS